METKNKKKAEHLATALLESIMKLQDPIIIESDMEREQMKRIKLNITLLNDYILEQDIIDVPMEKS